MLSTMIRPLTFLITLSLILVIAFPVAKANVDASLARRQAPHRLLKKRAVARPQAGVDNAAAAGTDPIRDPIAPVQPQPAAPPPPVAAPPAKGTDTAVVPIDPTRPANVPVVTLTEPLTAPLPSSTQTLVGGKAANSSLTSLTSSLSTSSSSSTSLSSTSLTSSTPTSTSTTASVTPLETTVTTSSTQAATATASTSQHSVTKLQRNTIIILIAIGGSIGAAGLIWTIIRKWKFKPSSSFEDRMQPIDWQPTAGPVGDRDIAEKLNRSPSVVSHGSFISGNNNHTNLSDLPPHDFTAGPSHLAPVGGYADLQRGPSPLGDVHAGPGPYNYDIPNPHGYYNNVNGYQGGYDHRGY